MVTSTTDWIWTYRYVCARTHLFWVSDLIYKLDMHIKVHTHVGSSFVINDMSIFSFVLFTGVRAHAYTQEILNYINRKEFEPLLKVDQLNLEREKNKVFLRFGTFVSYFVVKDVVCERCVLPPAG